MYISIGVICSVISFNSKEVKHIKEILYALVADIIRHQTVNSSALPDLQNLSTHDFAVLLKDDLLPEHIKVYRSYMQKLDVKNLKIF
jgi:hypothetical protein